MSMRSKIFDASTLSPNLRKIALDRLEVEIKYENLSLDRLAAETTNEGIKAECKGWKEAVNALPNQILKGEKIDLTKLPNSLEMLAGEVFSRVTYWQRMDDKEKAEAGR